MDWRKRFQKDAVIIDPKPTVVMTKAQYGAWAMRKLHADLEAGRITEEDFEALIEAVKMEADKLGTLGTAFNPSGTTGDTDTAIEDAETIPVIAHSDGESSAETATSSADSSAYGIGEKPVLHDAYQGTAGKES